MTQAASGARGRAVRGIEAAATVLRHAVEAFAVLGGEGAARLGVALEAARGPAARIAGEGLAAANAALERAREGRRTAVVVSGAAVLAALPAVRASAEAGLPVLWVVPAHGVAPSRASSAAPDAAPGRGLDELSHLLALPMGVLVAGDAEQVGDAVLAGLRAAVERGAPWVVAFEYATVGLALANAHVPDAEQIAAWTTSATPAAVSEPGAAGPAGLEQRVRDAERFDFAISAAMRELERATRHRAGPVLADGVRDAELVIVAAGAAARAAQRAVPHMHARAGRHVGAVQVLSLRPFPAAEVVRLSWRARAVIVHEALPEALNVAGGLSGAVRAAFADALTWHPAYSGIGRIPPVVTVLGEQVTPEQWLTLARAVGDAADPPRLMLAATDGARGGAAETAVEVMMDEHEGADALRLVVDWLARTGTSIAAHAHEPRRAGLALARGAVARGPGHVLLVCEGGHGDPAARVADLPAGSLVVLAGDFPDRVLADTMRAAAPRAIRVATLGGHGAKVRGVVAVAAVLRTLVPDDADVDAALQGAAHEAGAGDADAFVAEVRALAGALSGHL